MINLQYFFNVCIGIMVFVLYVKFKLLHILLGDLIGIFCEENMINGKTPIEDPCIDRHVVPDYWYYFIIGTQAISFDLGFINHNIAKKEVLHCAIIITLPV